MSALFTSLAQSDSGGTGAFILSGGILIVVLIVSIAVFAFWLWMLIDLLKSNRPSNEKIVWALVMIFVGVLGSLIYFFVARGSAGRASA